MLFNQLVAVRTLGAVIHSVEGTLDIKSREATATGHHIVLSLSKKEASCFNRDSSVARVQFVPKVLHKVEQVFVQRQVRDLSGVRLPGV